MYLADTEIEEYFPACTSQPTTGCVSSSEGLRTPQANGVFMVRIPNILGSFLGMCVIESSRIKSNCGFGCDWSLLCINKKLAEDQHHDVNSVSATGHNPSAPHAQAVRVHGKASPEHFSGGHSVIQFLLLDSRMGHKAMVLWCLQRLGWRRNLRPGNLTVRKNCKV